MTATPAEADREPQVAPDPVALDAAAGLAGLLERLVGGTAVTDYVVAEPDWEPIAEGGWDLLAADDRNGGFGLTLRDLIEVAQVAGRFCLPLPLSTTFALDPATPSGGGRPFTVAVPRRSRPDESRVPYGSMPAVTVLGCSAGSGPLEGTAVDPFAPSLRLVRTPGPARLPDLTARRRLAVLWAAETVGAARALHGRSVAYAKDRVQFGVPIGRFQAVKHLLAKATVALAEATTAVVMAAADTGGTGLWSAVRLACDRSVTVSEIGTQVHGGIGVTWELGNHVHTRHILVLRDLVADLAAVPAYTHEPLGAVR